LRQTNPTRQLLCKTLCISLLMKTKNNQREGRKKVQVTAAFS